MDDSCQTHKIPKQQRRRELDYEEIFLAFEAAARKAESTQITHHGGQFRVRMITRDADAVCYHRDLDRALEMALERIGVFDE